MESTSQTGRSRMKSIGSEFKGVVIGILFITGLILGSQAPVPRLAQRGVVPAPAGPERYLTHVSTDKPIYRIGEKVYVRGVVLRADSHSPVNNARGSIGTASF